MKRFLILLLDSLPSKIPLFTTKSYLRRLSFSCLPRVCWDEKEVIRGISVRLFLMRMLKVLGISFFGTLEHETFEGHYEQQIGSFFNLKSD